MTNNMTQDSKKWFALYTRSRAEKKLHEQLTRKEVECFLPLQKVLRQRSDRKKWVEEPLLRSYLFVRVSEKEYYEVLNTAGAVRYVCFEGKASPIPEQQIQALENFLQHRSGEIEVYEGGLESGDVVEVIYGPLKGTKGEVLQLRGNHRLVLRFDTLGLCVHTEISLSDVKPVERREQAA